MTPRLRAAVARLEYALQLLDGTRKQGADELYLDPPLTVICYARRVVAVAKEPE